MCPQELYDLEGKKVEALTPEEVEEQKQAAVDQAKAEAEAGFVSEKEGLEKEKADLQLELEKAKDKEQNFANLRNLTDKEKAEKEVLEKRIGEIKGELDQRDQKIQDFVVGGAKTEIINKYAGGDSEIIEAITANYERIKGPETTKAEIEERVKEAYGMTCAQVGLDPLDMDVGNTLSAGGGGRAVGEVKKPEISQEGKQLGKEKFGLSDQDFDKHLKK